ncbi:hypothetical protein DAERI_030201 [Deinococcus aerius]|uniref:Uncharacterized protein n=1 Tax=Deinococcus aerius TaxID=200253 RepID=A0A2I9DWQ3_9DEIO|nr:DUF6683 family protein [Deinococcus aerius]GBF05035.1 hypothetical protein DAERI_030201 [Deinococcus aerius]
MRRVLALAALGTLSLASAQYDFLTDNLNMMNMMMGNFLLMNSVMMNAVAEQEARRQEVQKAVEAERARLEPRGRAVIAAGRATTTFRPSAGSAVLDAFAGALASDPRQRPRAREALGTLMNEYRRLSAGYGLSTSDLADGLAFSAAASYETLVAGAHEMGKNDLAALRAHIRPRLLADPVTQGMNDAERQEMQEGLVLLTLVGVARYEVAGQQRSEAAFREARDLLGTLFEAVVGAPYQKVRFTPQGLVIRRD